MILKHGSVWLQQTEVFEDDMVRNARTNVYLNVELGSRMVMLWICILASGTDDFLLLEAEI